MNPFQRQLMLGGKPFVVGINEKRRSLYGDEIEPWEEAPPPQKVTIVEFEADMARARSSLNAPEKGQ